MTNPGADRAQDGADEGQRWHSRLHQTLASGAFAVTAEIVPPRGASLNGIKRIATHLQDWIDAANITDGQGAVARMSSWAGSLGLLQAGRGACDAVLLPRPKSHRAAGRPAGRARRSGIPNVLCLTGDHPRFGDHPDAKPVFDMDSVQLLWTARTLRDEKHLLSGMQALVARRGGSSAPSRTLPRRRSGSGPSGSARRSRPGRSFSRRSSSSTSRSSSAGWQQVRDLGLDKRCGIIAGVGPIRSPKALELLSQPAGRLHPGGGPAARAVDAGGAPGAGRDRPLLRDDPAAARDSWNQRRPYNCVWLGRFHTGSADARRHRQSSRTGESRRGTSQEPEWRTKQCRLTFERQTGSGPRHR